MHYTYMYMITFPGDWGMLGNVAVFGKSQTDDILDRGRYNRGEPIN